jgi:hypothetical protein
MLDGSEGRIFWVVNGKEDLGCTKGFVRVVDGTEGPEGSQGSAPEEGSRCRDRDCDGSARDEREDLGTSRPLK